MKIEKKDDDGMGRNPKAEDMDRWAEELESQIMEWFRLALSGPEGWQTVSEWISKPLPAGEFLGDGVLDIYGSPYCQTLDAIADHLCAGRWDYEIRENLAWQHPFVTLTYYHPPRSRL